MWMFCCKQSPIKDEGKQLSLCSHKYLTLDYLVIVNNKEEFTHVSGMQMCFQEF